MLPIMNFLQKIKNKRTGYLEIFKKFIIEQVKSNVTNQKSLASSQLLLICYIVSLIKKELLKIVLKRHRI